MEKPEVDYKAWVEVLEEKIARLTAELAASQDSLDVAHASLNAALERERQLTAVIKEAIEADGALRNALAAAGVQIDSRIAAKLSAAIK